MDKTIQNGKQVLQVDDIRSFHEREVENIIKPIDENNSLLWVDKEKGLNWLSSASHNVRQEIDNQDLIVAANKVISFKNPHINGVKNSQNESVRFRSSDSFSDDELDDVADDLRSYYDAAIKMGFFMAREAIQDSMLCLKILMDKIAKFTGKTDARITASTCPKSSCSRLAPMNCR